MRIALAAVGFTSTIAQVVLMREMVATFYGNELLFGLVLAAWLAWVAVGSWGLARLTERRQLGTRTFAAGLLLAAVLLPAQIGLVRAVRILLGVTPGALVEFGLKPGLATIAKLLRPQNASYKLFVGRGEVIPTDPDARGSVATIKTEPSPEQFLNTMLEHGVEHHLVIAYGDWTQDLKQFARFADVEIIQSCSI